MNQTRMRCALFAWLLTSCCGSNALSQDFYHHPGWFGFHRGHFHPPVCWDRPFIREYIVEVPVIQHWIAPTPVFVPQSVPFVAGVAQPNNLVNRAAGPVENFARKQIAPRIPMVQGQRAINDEHEIRRRAAVLKPSTPEGRMRADRLISSGDRAFADQVFARATARYRDAIAKAPDYAESHFRLAHAYVATRQYNLALKSALVALELSGTARRDGFSLEDMYQGDNFARDQHFKRLVDASMREPDDGGLQFLIGFTLHFSGQQQKALEFFHRAETLPGPQESYAQYFLPAKPVAEAVGLPAEADRGAKLPAEAAN